MRKIKQLLTLTTILTIFGTFCTNTITVFSDEISYLENETYDKSSLEAELSNLQDKYMPILREKSSEKNTEMVLKEVKEKQDEIMKSYGFDIVELGENIIDPLANNSSELQLNDSIYFNPIAKEYNYRATWDFIANTFNTTDGVDDILGFRMSNDNFTITGDYLYSYDNYGYKTGECLNGSNATTSYVNKRYQDSTGILWNLRYGYKHGSNVYYGDNGLVSIYLKRNNGSSSSTTLYFDMEHNYQKPSIAITPSFSITGTNISPSGLTVNYNGTPLTYHRTSQGKTTYTSANEKQTGWVKFGDKWYYFNSYGNMVKGWLKLSDKWYYLSPSSGEMLTGWQQISEKWYYFYDGGSMATGWIQPDSYWYYLDPVNGDMKTGWQQINNKWYYFYSPSGKMATNTIIDGWKIDGNGVATPLKSGQNIANFHIGTEEVSDPYNDDKPNN